MPCLNEYTQAQIGLWFGYGIIVSIFLQTCTLST